eukprot:gene29571-38689_t
MSASSLRESIFRKRVDVEPNLDEPHVLEHLRKLNGVFSEVKDLNIPDLYVYLSQLEREYMHRAVDNFAATVHQLNPRAYEEDELKLSFVRIKRSNDRALSDRMHCPYCWRTLTPINAYRVHIKKATVTCETCYEPITCEALALAIFVQNFNRGDYPIKSYFDVGTKLVITTQNSSWKTFSSYMLQLVRSSRKMLALPTQLQRVRAIYMRREIRDLVAPLRSNIPRGSVVTVPVMEPSVVPQNQLNNNLNDCSESKTSSALWFFSAFDSSGCAGACESSACAAGSCGTSGCGGSCGGGGGCRAFM